ncbi:MAG: hypothetical protein Q9159_003673 [Coniocarpon cinnabarinum]
MPAPDNDAGMQDVESQDTDMLDGRGSQCSVHAEKSPQDHEVGSQGSLYPSWKVILPTMASIYLAVFLASIDRTIIAVAIPAISDHFNSFADIAWYEASYLLSFCTLQLPTGRLYVCFPKSFQSERLLITARFIQTNFTPKWVFIPLVIIFEIGSVVCAAAPTSDAFIVGRTIAGIGGAGILSGATIIIVDLLPLRQRPKYQGGLGAVVALSAILGPLIGGVFTSKVTWRWCFWINLPIGALAIVSLLVILPASPPAQKLEGTPRQKLAKLDPLGNSLLIPGIICLLFALQFGGTRYAWNDARIIALLVVGLILLLAFAAVEIWVVGENGVIPRRIVCQRSIASGILVNLGQGGAFLVSSFYLPIWFQAIKGFSAVDAGIRLLPYFLGSVAFVISSGFIISKTGYYTPWLIGGLALIIVGSGLLTTFKVSTNTGEWVGYQVSFPNDASAWFVVASTDHVEPQIVLGAGVGMSLQQTIIAAQTVLPKEDVPIGVTVMGFAQIFGGTLFVPVCQAILANTLSSELSSKIPGVDSSTVTSAGATDIRNLVPRPDLSIFLDAYNKALDNVFYVAVGLASVALLASCFVEWKSVKRSTNS